MHGGQAVLRNDRCNKREALRKKFLTDAAVSGQQYHVREKMACDLIEELRCAVRTSISCDNNLFRSAEIEFKCSHHLRHCMGGLLEQCIKRIYRAVGLLLQNAVAGHLREPQE